MTGQRSRPRGATDDATAIRGLQPLADATDAAATTARILPTDGDAPGRATPAPAAAANPDTVADAEPWATVFGDPAVAPEVLSVAVDGATVYVGGNFFFDFAGMANETYNRIAMWDGTGWQRLGSGLNGAVHAIAVVGTDVYVGGEFTVAGGVAAERLARWDGTVWSPVAGGVGDPDRPWNNTAVRALVADGSTLYVGGTFARAGDTPARSLAALSLETGEWTTPGGGVWSGWSPDPAEVRALLLAGTTLYVGGAFDRAGETEATSLAALDVADGSWTSFGGVTNDGLGGFVNALAHDDASGTLFVGGRFTHAGDVRAWNVARLSGGRFEAIGDASYYGGSQAEIFALAAAGGLLYAGGNFTTIGGSDAAHWGVYDGRAWTRPGDGLDMDVRALARHGEAGVVALGAFTISGSLRLLHGGIWTGERWATFGQGPTVEPEGGGEVRAIVPSGGGAYVGGLFDQVGHLHVGSVARWTGEEWDVMAGGVRQAITHGRVRAMAQIGTDLYVAGVFVTAGDVAVNNIARWDGTRWWPLGEGVNDAVFSLAVLGGRLYVGGAFHLAGRVPVGRLACWDPATETWSAVGHGPVFDHDVLALAAINDRYLAIGGTFQRFFHRGVTIYEGLWGLTLFDTGRELEDRVLSGYLELEGVSRWGAPGWVHALQVVGGELYVGGWFNVAGIRTVGPAPSAGFPVGHLAVWRFGLEEPVWEPCGDADDHVDALTSVDGALVAGGSFRTVGRTAANHVARLDRGERTWHPFGSGLSGGRRDTADVWSLAQGAETGLWAGGWFAAAGGRPSANVALWSGTQGQGP